MKLVPAFALHCSLFLALAPQVWATPFSYSFGALKAGNLVGQDGWQQIGDHTSPLVREAASSANKAVAASNPAAPLSVVLASKNLPANQFPSEGVITITIKLNKNTLDKAGPGTCGVALGDVKSLRDPDQYVGVINNRWTVFGKKLLDAKGQPLSPRPNEWFEVKVTINPAANGGLGAAKIEVSNLTGPKKVSVPLYFDAEQREEVTSLEGKLPPPDKWTSVGVIFGGGSMKAGDVEAPRGGEMESFAVESGAPEGW